MRVSQMKGMASIRKTVPFYAEIPWKVDFAKIAQYRLNAITIFENYVFPKMHCGYYRSP